jgi:hypothetical protein
MWQQQVFAKPIDEMIKTLVFAGFIWTVLVTSTTERELKGNSLFV